MPTSDVLHDGLCRRAAWAAGVIGFALGGFIDGILLHQVLQWHHLLSLVEGESLRDIRTQILADGLFHVLMWRAREGVTGRAADRALIGAALLGFGIWQIVDVVGFHWILVIHRIRVGVPNPLLWDLGWLVLFAVPSLAAAWLILRRPGVNDDDGRGEGRPRAVPTGLAALAIVAGPLAALPPRGVTTAVVVFRSGMEAGAAIAAAADADARVLWASEAGDVLAVDLGGGGSATKLYASGAILISTSSVIAGCIGWVKL